MNYLLLVVGMIVLFVVIFYSFISDDNSDELHNMSDEDEEIENKDDESFEEKPIFKLVPDTSSSEELDIETIPNEEVKENESNVEEPQEENINEESSSSIQSEELPKEELEVKNIQNNVVAFEDRNQIKLSKVSNEEESVSKPVEITRIFPESKGTDPDLSVLQVGSEDDLRLRLELKQTIAKPVSLTKNKSVAAVVQFRIPDDILKYSDDLVSILENAESVFEKQYSFPFKTYQTTQLNRILLFEPSEERDIIVESLIVAYEIIIRFRKILESNKILRENKVRIAIGLSMGDVTFINRGVNSEPTLIGKPIYLAETLADIVNDFGIYVDQIIRTATIPMFDFKEWKPTVVRSNLPAIPLYELAGFNKPEEIASFVKSEDPAIRRAVAVAYRYFDLDDLHPLVELLRDKDRNVVYKAIYTISYIGSDKTNGALKLKLPEATDPDIKSKIIEAFGNAGNPGIIPVILASTKENSWKVRLAATKALYQLGASGALPHIEPMLNDEDNLVRIVANSIFFNETKKPEYFEVLKNGLRNASKRARATSIECLLAIDSETSLKEITNVFGKQELDLQKHILSKMLKSKCKILYQCFLTMFRNSSESLRPYIVEAVRQAGIVS